LEQCKNNQRFAMIVHARLSFGTKGNAQGCLIDGWDAPAADFIWAVDGQCALRMPSPPHEAPLALEMDVSPFQSQTVVKSQRLAVRVGNTLVGETFLDRTTTLCFDIPRGGQGSTGGAIVTLTFSDADNLAGAGLTDGQRRLGLKVHGMRLIATEAGRPILPRSLAPLRITAPTPAALDEAVRACAGCSTGDLLRNFESLGHNCEFGLMQRDLDAEPLGLLRFGGIELPSLLLGLECAFAGIDDPNGLGLETGRMNGREEYLVRDRHFGVRIHTGQFLDEVPAEGVDFSRMARHIAFLQRQFAGVLHDASRIFVLHHPDLRDAARALPILNRLRSHGDNALLYVTEHPTVPPGMVVQERAQLFHGYIDQLVPMNEAARINLGAWVSLCANTQRLVKASAAPMP
jgi:hypothetical protein